MSNLKKDIEKITTGLTTFSDSGLTPEEILIISPEAREATTQIIDLIEAVIPEEMQQIKEEENSDWFYGYGYNACIADIKSKLIDGSE